MTAAIELSGLTKSFGAVRAVDGIDASIEGGKVTAFLGPNGAGKTTTLRMLLGLVAPTAGTAAFAGKRYAELRAIRYGTSARRSRPLVTTPVAPPSTTCACSPPQHASTPARHSGP